MRQQFVERELHRHRAERAERGGGREREREGRVEGGRERDSVCESASLGACNASQPCDTIGIITHLQMKLFLTGISCTQLMHFRSNINEPLGNARRNEK